MNVLIKRSEGGFFVSQGEEEEVPGLEFIADSEVNPHIQVQYSMATWHSLHPQPLSSSCVIAKLKICLDM